MSLINGEKITSKDISDILIASPFTKEGKNRYDYLPALFFKRELKPEQWRKEFLNEIYAEPYFLEKKHEGNFEPTKEKDRFDRNSIEKYDIGYMRKLRQSYEGFEKHFIGDSDKNALQKPLFVVIGTVGSGKSIFTYKLISKRDNIHCFDENFELKSEDTAHFISGDIDIGYVSPINAFVLLLAHNIGKCFCKPQYTIEYGWRYDVISRVEDLKKLVNKISSTYKEYFNNKGKNVEDSRWCLNFFNHLEEMPKNLKTVDEVTNHIKKYIEEIMNNTYRSGNESTIEVLTDILLRLYFCLIRTVDSYKDKKILLFIDNIENALVRDGNPTSEITTSHIKSFLSATCRSARKFSDRISEMGEVNPASVLLAMRDCTSRILNDLRNNEFLSLQPGNYMSHVEITEWFDNEDILTNRIKYFTGYKSLQEMLDDKNLEKSHGIIAYLNIIKDRSNSLWGLCDFINQFYNSSKRYIHERFIGGFLDYYEKYKGNENELKFFNEQWKFVNRSKKNEGYDELKYLCRKYIIRLLLDYVNIHNEGKFFAFKHTNEIESEESSYARRILIYLSYKRQLEDTTSESDKIIPLFDYVSSSELIDNLLVCGKNAEDITDDKIKSFSNILWKLNRFLENDTHWTGLVYIQAHHGGVFNIKEHFELVKCDWENYKHGNRDVKKVEIRLTYAGEIYTKIMPDFEYFTCRYLKKFPPLLAIKNHRTLEKLLHGVLEETKKCRNIVNSNEKVIRSEGNVKWDYPVISEDGTVEKIEYTKQLVKSQKGYVKNFKKYLESSLCKISKDESNLMIDKIDEYLTSF